MSYDVTIFGLHLTLKPIAFTLPIGGGWDIYWYGIIIALGFTLAIIYGIKNAPRFNVNVDRMLDVAIVTTPVAILCARAYYVIFEGESRDPQRVADEIKAEINRLRVDGIDKKLFSAVKCGAYGNMVRKFNSVEDITMLLTECAMCDYDLFEEVKLLKTVSYDDVLKRLDVFDDENAVLSVISPLED